MHQYGEAKDLVFINLHDDEKTSVEATKILLEKRGGLLIKIENNGQRNIKFKMGPSVFEFDPNHMFSQKGIRSTLGFNHKRVNEKVVNEIERLGQWILNLIPESPKCIIALHNNTDGYFSIHDYLPGHERSEASAKVNISRQQDADDLFLTTEEEIYNSLAEAQYNILLQDNKNAQDDGSLSIYCGRNNISYVNCETQHGKLNQYKEMIEKLLDVLDGSQKNEYDFIMQPGAPADIEESTKIYFNNKEVGFVKTGVTNNEGNNRSGKLVIKKEFMIYSNTDFFFMKKENTTNYIEIRIDPTREKNSINTSLEPIKIIVKSQGDS